MKIFKIFARLIRFIIKITMAMAAINFVFTFLGKRKQHGLKKGKYYSWKYGDVFYRKKGNGAPVLVLHGLEPSHSGKDLKDLNNYLSTVRTVYSIDLLGFGASSKPWITYTNYLYVQLIQDFIKNVIGEPVDIVAYGGSSLFALQAYALNKDLIHKVALVNPSRSEKYHVSKLFALKAKKILDLPLLGTFIYNMYSLAGSVPFDKEGRHVFASRLTGHLTSDITPYENLMTDNVTLFEIKDSDTIFTNGDIAYSLE